MRAAAGSLLLLLIAAADLAPRVALAQPGDVARSWAADIGVVGQFGEPVRGLGFADGIKCRVRPQDEVWVVSSRHLAWPACGTHPPALKFWRWDCGKNNWTKRPAEAFFQSDSAAVVTMVYVHGNRFDSWQAIDAGWYAYDAVAGGGGDERPVRFVIYSWHSTRVLGSQLNDLRCKSDRTNADGYYLGWLVAHIRDDVPLSLMGFSYGARIITGALHVAAGGELCGLALSADAPRRRGNVNSVLMAAALHNYWLSPGCFHGRAIESSGRMLILANPCDKILRRYHWVFRGARPQALGVTGLAGCDASGRIAEYDCSGCLGDTHDSLLYLDNPSLMKLWRPYMFCD